MECTTNKPLKTGSGITAGWTPAEDFSSFALSTSHLHSLPYDILAPFVGLGFAGGCLVAGAPEGSDMFGILLRVVDGLK